MNKKLSIILILLLTLLVFILVGGLIMLLKNDFSFSSFNFSTGYAKKLEEKEIDNIKSLNINSKIADIIIKSSERNNIKVELYSEYAEKYEITELDNEIKIVLFEKNRLFAFSKNPKIVVYVPINYNNNVIIDNETGDIDIKELLNSNIDIKLTTGDVDIDKTNSANIKTTTSDIKISEANELNLSVTTGDIKIGKTNELISAGTTGDVIVDSVKNIVSTVTTGDFYIKNVSNSMTLSSTTGDVRIDNAIVNNNSKIDTTTGDVNIKTISNCYVEAKTKVGDTRVNNNDRKSDIELVINSKVGDIKVNY